MKVECRLRAAFRFRQKKGDCEMEKLKAKTLAICILLSIQSSSFSQQGRQALTCKNMAYSALKTIPELSYACPEDITSESDDRILKSPERISAINNLKRELATFTDNGWWESAVEDLNVCSLRGKPGALSAEERQQFRDPEYQVKLLGNNRIRLVLVADPCYQTYYNGTNVFLLYRESGKVYVTEVLDGYYSRLPNSISMKSQRRNGGEVIEIGTVNILGMRPDTTNYYFVIDQRTKRAVPTKLPKRSQRRN